MKSSDTNDTPITMITPKSGMQFADFKELKEYRDLFFFLVWREVKILYAQTILGFGWAILQPLIQIVIFTFVFGKVAKVSSDGIPYLLFSSIAIIPWTYMSQSMTQSSMSLVTGQGMLGKVYFPRLAFPMTPVLARLIDFGVSMIIILAVMIYYQVSPTLSFLLIPLFLVMMICVPAGIGMWLSALSIRFRDVKHAMPFVVRMLIFTAPIVYSASSIPQSYRFLYSLNPIVGVIEGFRACMLGLPIPWLYILPGMIIAPLLFISGVFYFKRMELVFADVI
jgi:lipopolysaccharide transport system permease protein